jgi:hypothetical protein
MREPDVSEKYIVPIIRVEEHDKQKPPEAGGKLSLPDAT